MRLLAKIETWETNPVEVGPLYPGVGSELVLYVICVAAWISWTIWQMKLENRTYRDQSDSIRQQGLETILDRHRAAD